MEYKPKPNKRKIIIIGGGAAGFFAAANLSAHLNKLDITILESSDEVMKKIIISGGGRCNVTHACFDPKDLTENYPRGERELLSPFTKFACGDTIDWFQKRGVELKIEEDGRMFPTTDSSKTIADCLYKNSIDKGVKIVYRSRVDAIKCISDHHYEIICHDQNYTAEFVIIATGSNIHMWKILNELGIKTLDPVASLFTFNTKDTRLRDLSGLTFPHVQLKIKSAQLESEGPLLITHWGFSGPSVLRLSAWGARALSAQQYKFNLQINFTGDHKENVIEFLYQFKEQNPKKNFSVHPLFEIPKRYWSSICTHLKISDNLIWADATKNNIHALAEELTNAQFAISGKSTNKDEFVTAGGVELGEIDFKTYQHKRYKGMYFIGEVLDIDGITGGFNFQNAWTGAWLATQNIIQTTS